MKTFPVSPLLLALALVLPAPAEDAPPVVPPEPAPEAAPVPPGRFTLEFRGARLGQVLDFLSKEAGFVIANPVDLPQPLTLVAKQPVDAAEAVAALNGVLITQGHAAILRGRTLHIVALPSARQQNLPVAVGTDPAAIPDSDELVTQILPVQYATVKDLAENLQPLLNSATATLAANEAANVLILTDTRSHVRRIAAIIAAIDGAVGGEMAVRVFHLTHADAEKVATVLNSIYGKSTSSSSRTQGGAMPPFMQMFNQGQRGGQTGQGSGQGSSGRNVDVNAAADSGTNSVVVRAPPAVMATIATVVEQLDVDTTARQDVLVYKVRNGKAADLATSLTTLFQGTTTSTTGTSTRTTGNQSRQTPFPMPGQQTAATADGTSLDLSGQVRVVADTTSNAVLVLSLERNFDRIRRMLADLDQPMRQVLVRVLMAEVSYQKALDLGFEFSRFDPADSGRTRAFTNFGTFDAVLGSDIGFNGFVLNGNQFSAAVRALATDSRFDVLSRPYILTTDNQQAVVNVSENVPVINGSRTDQNNNVTTTFDRQDVGIILTVTPQINSEGRVLLDVNQVVSALTDQSVAVGGDANSPIIKKRTMTTRVAVDSGQTVVVGGLVHDALVEEVSKVPWLGDIPWLGALFRRTQRAKAKTELLLFLTPQVIVGGAEMGQVGRQLRGEVEQLDAAVEKGLLQRHLDQLSRLKVGAPLPAAPAEGGP
jgi:general secretion pathway protein D